jgi:hypothetical protein
MKQRMSDEEFDRQMDAHEAQSMSAAARFAWREACRARKEAAVLREALVYVAGQTHNGRMMGPGDMSDLALKALEDA